MAQGDGNCLQKLRTMRDEVKLEVAKERKAFLEQFHGLISSWKGKLPNLRDVFRPEEIELLLAESVEFDPSFKASAFIKFLIRTGYKDEAKVADKDGDNVRVTAVHHAARRGFMHRNYLINDLFVIYDRFDVNYSDENGYTHFHVACESGCDYVVKKFLELGQDPDCCLARNNKSSIVIDPPLHMALVNGCSKVVELLLRHGADPNLAVGDGSAPLHLVCRKANQASVFAKMLLEIDDVRVDAQDKLGNTPFHLALRYGNKKLFEPLLRRMSDPNLADVEGLTPLHIICQKFNNDDHLRLFFRMNDDYERSVRVNAQDSSGNTPLHLALSDGRMSVSKLLMARGADPNVANGDGVTPLHLICQKDDSDSLMETLYEICDEAERKVQANAWDNANRTPLQWAVARLLPKTVGLLLDRGADLSYFEFPSEAQFDEAWRLWKNPHSYRTRLAQAALLTVERLQREYYRPDRSDALTLMRLLKKHEMFKKPFKPEVGRLCRKWALEFFLTLTHYRLPILCCDIILDDLEDDDICNLCLAATGLNSTQRFT
ncbi:homeobox protein Wariai-like [Trichogramma pretiosum]|uniref:homeobox protein Wariai-like n=1 Tax=Trichogramma pretiosum TaxID=7493 RepID=UPI000C719C53|nr:homeobox protein Wariai-like [Trichogramma pretiosum]